MFLYQELGLSLDNTRIIPGLSTDNKCKESAIKHGPYDLVYIDGGHDYETVVNDIELSDKILKTNGLLVMDDASSLLNFKFDHKGFKGHQEVGLAIKDKLDNNPQYKHLFACGHNRVWKKVT
jgi:predicted O-methyltransferase YrrM